jgi:hypothetical protein
MIMSKQEQLCPHDLNWTDEEEDALVWLQHNLQETASKCDSSNHGPTSRMAFIAHAAISKVINKAHDLHDRVHALERELDRAEMMVTGLAGLPQATGMVGEGDLN